MPGWSLWLLPPKSSLADTYVSHAITSTVPELFPHLSPLPCFSPHITLTSNIIPSDSMKRDPQQWLDGLKLDLQNKVRCRFESLETEKKFFKKLFIRCEKDKGLLELCEIVRMCAVEGGDEQKAKDFVERDYDPHCSLMYAEAEVTPQMLSLVNHHLESLAFQSTESSTRSSVGSEKQVADQKLVRGWIGGRIWLVPTDRALEDWKHVAERVIEA